MHGSSCVELIIIYFSYNRADLKYLHIQEIRKRSKMREKQGIDLIDHQHTKM